MGMSNSGCCCLGIATGFVLALVVAAAITYFVYWRKDPDMPRQNMESVEVTWEKVKLGGDRLIENAKKHTHGEQIRETPTAE